ncbi:hypothetical protein OCU04_002246 [Sclerotinia nivalis]|uniref:BTB domain-containing protein n=1 Tax=Sclerotinia nivalis TaxID=352851 RepID=A0A9X0DRM2_9HELO|nr:hypothetical protein OCU04_002246 [Sclerotinia nivalis]
MASPSTSTSSVVSPFLSFIGVEMVDLYVGPSKTHYRVHKAFLCSKIPYFNKMFNSNFSEALSNSATFPEDSTEAFDILIEWLYTGSLRPLELNLSSQKCNWNVYSFYILVDKLCMSDLMNETMDFKRRFDYENSRIMRFNTARNICASSPQGSKLRLYALNCTWLSLFVVQASDIRFDELLSVALYNDSDFSDDFLTIFEDKIGDRRCVEPRVGNDGLYHVHGKGISCSCPPDARKDD